MLACFLTGPNRALEEREEYIADMPGHHHPQPRSSRRRLVFALLITAVWFLVEIIAGVYTNSLALIADATHMLTDLAALGLSLFALVISSRPATHDKTYGYLRAEILAALANGVFLVVIALYISYEALHRLAAPPVVKSQVMLTVSVFGLLANLGAAGVLYRSQHDNLNMRGAFLHVLADAVGSVGAIGAGLAMVLWEWYPADPIASLVVSLLVLCSAWQLVRESVDILLEAAPSHIDVSSILDDLGKMPGVLSVHDLHVWSITSGMPALSGHVVLREGVDSKQALRDLSRLMREKYRIEHTTIQIEVEDWVRPQGSAGQA